MVALLAPSTDFQVQLIAAVIDLGSLHDCQQAGLTEEHFSQWPDVWRFVEQHHRQFGRTPTRQSLENRFPRMSFPRGQQGDLHFLIGEVRNQWLYDKMSDIMQQTVQLMTSPDNQVHDALAHLQAQTQLVQLQHQSTQRDTNLLVEGQRQVLDQAVRRIAAHHDPSLRGIHTGFSVFDQTTGGLDDTEFMVILARVTQGKALADHEPVLTPAGWRPISDSKVGDVVATQDGSFTEVTGVYPQGERETVEVRFSDGGSVQCDLDHLWQVQHRSDASYSVRTTRELMEWHDSQRGPTISVPIAEAVELPFRDLPVDAYTLGALLGDGTFRHRSDLMITCEDEIRAHMQGDWKVHHYQGKPPVYRLQEPLECRSYLKGLGLWGLKSREKFIPAEYLLGSIQQRKDLLAGLLDTDGSVTGGYAHFHTISSALAEGVSQLVRSLGGFAKSSWKSASYRDVNGQRIECQSACTVTIRLPFNPFYLDRKRQLYTRFDLPRRLMVGFKKSSTTSCTCITVAHPSRLFLTRDYTVTHNSWSLLYMAANALLQGKNVLFFPLEMSKTQVAFRLHVILQSYYLENHPKEMQGIQPFLNKSLTQGSGYDLPSYKKFLELLGDRLQGSFIVSETPGKLTPSMVMSKIQQHKPDAVYIDYLTLMRADGNRRQDAEDWQNVKSLTNDLKCIAAGQHVPVITAAQATRGAANRKGPPELEEIAFGDAIGQDADRVLSLKQLSRRVSTYLTIKDRHADSRTKGWLEHQWNQGKIREVSEAKAVDMLADDADRGDLISERGLR